MERSWNVGGPLAEKCCDRKHQARHASRSADYIVCTIHGRSHSPAGAFARWMSDRRASRKGPLVSLSRHKRRRREETERRAGVHLILANPVVLQGPGDDEEGREDAHRLEQLQDVDGAAQLVEILCRTRSMPRGYFETAFSGDARRRSSKKPSQSPGVSHVVLRLVVLHGLDDWLNGARLDIAALPRDFGSGVLLPVWVPGIASLPLIIGAPR